VTRDISETLEYADKMFKRQEEYEQKRKDKQNQMKENLNFTPQVYKSKKYKVDKDVVQRNKEFESMKQEKIRKRKDDEIHAYNF
jgi:hypothetical protein